MRRALRTIAGVGTRCHVRRWVLLRSWSRFCCCWLLCSVRQTCSRGWHTHWHRRWRSKHGKHCPERRIVSCCLTIPIRIRHRIIERTKSRVSPVNSRALIRRSGRCSLDVRHRSEDSLQNAVNDTFGYPGMHVLCVCALRRWLRYWRAWRTEWCRM